MITNTFIQRHKDTSMQMYTNQYNTIKQYKHATFFHRFFLQREMCLSLSQTQTHTHKHSHSSHFVFKLSVKNVLTAHSSLSWLCCQRSHLPPVHSTHCPLVFLSIPPLPTHTHTPVTHQPPLKQVLICCAKRVKAGEMDGEREREREEW